MALIDQGGSCQYTGPQGRSAWSEPDMRPELYGLNCEVGSRCSGYLSSSSSRFGEATGAVQLHVDVILNSLGRNCSDFCLGSMLPVCVNDFPISN